MAIFAVKENLIFVIPHAFGGLVLLESVPMPDHNSVVHLLSLSRRCHIKHSRGGILLKCQQRISWVIQFCHKPTESRTGGRSFSRTTHSGLAKKSPTLRFACCVWMLTGRNLMHSGLCVVLTELTFTVTCDIVTSSCVGHVRIRYIWPHDHTIESDTLSILT